MEQYLNHFKNCLQKEIPYCTAECPFHLDITDFIEKMKRGGFRGAFKNYRDAVGFPVIAAELCHEPCKDVCPRKGPDRAIALKLLERACMDFTADKSPTDYNLPMKKKKIAIIGAGISGLACALRLCMKKYEVEVFEASDRLGGHLWSLMSPEIFLTEINEQFQHEHYTIHYNCMVKTPEDLAGRGFDAVFVATGDGGEDFGLLSAGKDNRDTKTVKNGVSVKDGEAEQYCKVIDGAAWFAGGGLVGEAPVYALANGLNMGTVIESYLKTGNLINPENVRHTCIQLDPAKLETPNLQQLPAGRSLTEDEAKREAARCLECRCDFCRTYCDLTEFYGKWPLRIRDEILATTLPGFAEAKSTPAKRLLSTCNQCGLCKEVCPEEIDLGGLILEGRKSMHRQKKEPWAFHEFWLRDMDFANSASAALVMLPPGGAPAETAAAEANRQECGYAFFPGCQLGASDPELVTASYRHLLKIRPDTGLVLRCCGAPAEWSGDADKFDKELSDLREVWMDLGKPKMILACPTCEKKFKAFLPEIPVISLYELLAEDISSEISRKGEVYSVFDACAARHEPGMKAAVRLLAENAGCRLEPLPKHDQHEQCCGYGGQPGIANPKYTEFVVQKRISESDNPYITYCINCRDLFLDAGKAAVHILEILFGNPYAEKMLPTVSQRRKNRIGLKSDLLEAFWGIENDRTQDNMYLQVSISESLARKISKERILEEDLIEVIDFCQRTGRKTWLPEKGTYSGYKEVGNMTCWVEYRIVPNKAADSSAEGMRAVPASFEVVNAYAHGMRIELEPVWNGRKIEQHESKSLI